MLLLILGLGLLLIFVISTLLYKHTDWSSDEGGVLASYVIGGIMTVVSSIALVVCGIILSGAMTINEKIEMYQEENAQIQTDVSSIVENYMEWESEVYKQFNNESPIVLIQLYPELKSNDLVNMQIDLFIANNNAIKELKLQKLTYKPLKWWIYFGK